MYIAHFLQPFICRWIFRLHPYLGQYEQCCSERQSVNISNLEDVEPVTGQKLHSSTSMRSLKQSNLQEQKVEWCCQKLGKWGVAVQQSFSYARYTISGQLLYTLCLQLTTWYYALKKCKSIDLMWFLSKKKQRYVAILHILIMNNLSDDFIK